MLVAPARAPLVSSTLAAMRRLVIEGTGKLAAASLTTAAAWDVENPRDRMALARSLASRLRRDVRYVPDPYGMEYVQGLAETVERGGGDCEDFAVAFGTLARSVGLRTGFATLEEEDGRVAHVLPLVEDPARPGSWIPVELTTSTPFGVWPTTPKGASWRMEAIEDRAPFGGMGFLNFIAAGLGAAASIITGNQASKDAKKVAKINREAARAQADAVTESARLNAEAATSAANARSRAIADALATARDLAPLVVGGIGLAVALPALLGNARSPRRKRR